MDNDAYGVDGCWWGLRLKPEAFNRFDAADPRRSFFYTSGQTVAINTISDFAQGIAAPKYSNMTSTGRGRVRCDSRRTPTSRCSGWPMPT